MLTNCFDIWVMINFTIIHDQRHSARSLSLSYCGLVTSYAVIGLHQHWFRYWLVVWRHQVITLANVDVSSNVFRGIYMGKTQSFLVQYCLWYLLCCIALKRHSTVLDIFHQCKHMLRSNAVKSWSTVIRCCQQLYKVRAHVIVWAYKCVNVSPSRTCHCMYFRAVLKQLPWNLECTMHQCPCTFICNIIPVLEKLRLFLLMRAVTHWVLGELFIKSSKNLL